MQPDRKQITQITFDTVATGYDHPELAFFPTTAECMIRHLQLEPSVHLLDVCTGTGMLSLRAAQALPDGHVTGIDLASGMLEQARNKAQQQNLTNIQFQQMDMEVLDFAEHQFDVATCSFGLFFIDDMESCLRNIATKVRPGGKVAISTFVTDAFEPLSSLFLRRLESFGKETREDTWKRISNEPALRALFATAGMDEVEIHHEPLSYPMSAQGWWDIIWNAGYRGYVQQLSVEEQAEFQRQHLAEIEALCTSGHDRLNVGVLIAVGVV